MAVIVNGLWTLLEGEKHFPLLMRVDLQKANALVDTSVCVVASAGVFFKLVVEMRQRLHSLQFLC